MANGKHYIEMGLVKSPERALEDLAHNGVEVSDLAKEVIQNSTFLPEDKDFLSWIREYSKPASIYEKLEGGNVGSPLSSAELAIEFLLQHRAAVEEMGKVTFAMKPVYIGSRGYVLYAAMQDGLQLMAAQVCFRDELYALPTLRVVYATEE